MSDLDRRRLGELITGHVFDSSIKPPFISEAAPALEVRIDLCRSIRRSASNCGPAKSWA